MLRSCGRGTAGAVRARRCDHTAAGENQLARDRVRGHAHCHGVKPARSLQGDPVIFSNNHGQRTRPESVCQDPHLRGKLLGNGLHLGEIRDMHDQRIVRGPPLGRIDLPGGFGILRVSSQAIYGLCGKGHQASLAQNLPRLSQNLLQIISGHGPKLSCLQTGSSLSSLSFTSFTVSPGILFPPSSRHPIYRR